MEGYSGAPVSVTIPVSQPVYEFESYPPFFDGLLPEGDQLEGLLMFGQIDRTDLFSQLMTFQNNMAGNVSVKEITCLIVVQSLMILVVKAYTATRV